MTKKSDTIKRVVKPSFGTDPLDPWSAKANINETAFLDRYLKSRGINPQFASKDQKVAHSKTNQFKAWLKAHERDPIHESMSAEHTPTEKRLHALKRSIHVHKEIRVADGHKKLHGEELEQIDELSIDALQNYRQGAHSLIQHYKYASGKNKPEAAKVLAKREPGMKRATDKVSKKYKEIAANAPKREPEKYEDKYPLGGRDERSGRSYSEQFQFEEVDKKDTVTMDIPLLIRVLEFAREDMKSDVQLHKVVERLIDIRDQGTLTMDDYEGIIKEELNQLDEISKEKLSTYVANAPGSVEKLKKQGERAKKVETQYAKYKKATIRSANINKAKQRISSMGECMQPLAATQQPYDGANNPDDTVPAKHSTAQKVKLLLGGKKGVVKEDMYDHEKEDKPVTSPGKKMKFQKPGMDNETKQSPQAAAILTGGTTMTGEKRDTIEIDPTMKMRKQTPDSQKSL